MLSARILSMFMHHVNSSRVVKHVICYLFTLIHHLFSSANRFSAKSKARDRASAIESPALPKFLTRSKSLA